MNAKEIIKILEKDGWYKTSQRGSHKYYKHPIKKGKVTVADHGKIDIPPKTLSSIWKSAGLK